MTGKPSQNPHPWRKPLLAAEFIALAVLVGSMAMLGQVSDGNELNAAWLLIPAAASLVVFLSFLGLMYLRWIAAAGAGQSRRQRVLFGLLALTLLGVWAYAIAQTWHSLPG
ncbi:MULTISPECIES: hypothetical protein [Marinobacter]|uniref:Uncharacterized protein n=1 Tax=Marinobacter segnicrescens TaxID=430453 RepID=A0A1I0A084_9GAMM|nr:MULTISPECIES: hypothetical protein [Marinobacter]UZD66383.1 hypothetical protein LJ360_03210 [Marinobacter sp. AN1]SES86588.1 hypothetical protein SAMN04487962_102104 [Marinobacter segnicrescens]